MGRVFWHIYGPFSIQNFGMAIVLGLVVFSYCFLHDSRRKSIISVDNFFNVLFYGIVLAIVGGRLLALAADWRNMSSIFDILAFWQGGFSILGSVIAIIAVLPFYLRALKIQILPFLDLAALYAPILQSISRLGCLMAGCCAGQPCFLPWAITYTDRQSFAPLNQALHPTQIYSALLLFSLFLILYYIGQKKAKNSGQLFCFYLVGIGLERFLVDFFRIDREFTSVSLVSYLSIHQWIALFLIAVALLFYRGLIHTNGRYKFS